VDSQYCQTVFLRFGQEFDKIHQQYGTMAKQVQTIVGTVSRELKNARGRRGNAAGPIPFHFTEDDDGKKCLSCNRPMQGGDLIQGQAMRPKSAHQLSNGIEDIPRPVTTSAKSPLTSSSISPPRPHTSRGESVSGLQEDGWKRPLAPKYAIEGTDRNIYKSSPMPRGISRGEERVGSQACMPNRSETFVKSDVPKYLHRTTSPSRERPSTSPAGAGLSLAGSLNTQSDSVAYIVKSPDYSRGSDGQMYQTTGGTMLGSMDGRPLGVGASNWRRSRAAPPEMTSTTSPHRSEIVRARVAPMVKDEPRAVSPEGRTSPPSRWEDQGAGVVISLS